MELDRSTFIHVHERRLSHRHPVAEAGIDLDPAIFRLHVKSSSHASRRSIAVDERIVVARDRAPAVERDEGLRLLLYIQRPRYPRASERQHERADTRRPFDAV
jgi:hypothetical protein